MIEAESVASVDVGVVSSVMLSALQEICEALRSRLTPKSAT